MERQPKKIPLACYGLEQDRNDPICKKCKHFEGCRRYMGSRVDKVPLDRIKFDIVPVAFREESFDTDVVADPELPHLQRLYADCYLSVFKQNPTDNVSRFTEEIANSANHVGCSVRMYMLSVMVAHTVHEKTVVEHTEKLRAAKFSAKQLTGKLAARRAAEYQDMCHTRFGTFTLSSLAILTDGDDSQTMDAKMLRSEVTAATSFIRLTIFSSAPQEKNMYDSEELQLAPEWLAIERTYLDTVLKPFMAKTLKGTPVIERHRFSVVQTLGHYKRHLRSQRLVWLARQRIMPQAVQRVCASFGVQPDDFLHDPVYTIDLEKTPTLSPMRFWKTFALTLRHYHCWQFLHHEPSYFTPRRNEQRGTN